MGRSRRACWYVSRIAQAQRAVSPNILLRWSRRRARALARSTECRERDERKRDAQLGRTSRDPTTTTGTDSLTSSSEATRNRARRHEKTTESTREVERSPATAAGERGKSGDVEGEVAAEPSCVSVGSRPQRLPAPRLPPFQQLSAGIC